MKPFHKFLRRVFSHRIVTDFILVIFAFIALNVLSGLIGNSAYAGEIPAWLKPLWADTKSVISTNLLIITSVMSGISTVLLFVILYRYRTLNKKALLTKNLVELDDSLLRLLTQLIVSHHTKSKEALRKERKRLLYELLRDTMQTVLGDKRKGRAAVLAPDPSDHTGEYLKIIAYHNMTEPTLSRTKFYIGDDETRSSEYGTAGVAYLKQQVCGGKMTKQGDRWICDNENYRVFDENRVTPSYDTFINIPIIGPPKAGKANSLGVLCLDSTIPDVFDSRGTQEALQSISRRFAAALSIYEEFIGFQP